MAQVGRASPSPVVAPLLHRLADSLSPVLDLGQEQDLAVLPHQRQAGGLRAGIDLQSDLLGLASDPVPETDREGMEPHHDGAALLQEFSRPGRVAWHQRERRTGPGRRRGSRRSRGRSRFPGDAGRSRSPLAQPDHPHRDPPVCFPIGPPDRSPQAVRKQTVPDPACLRTNLQEPGTEEASRGWSSTYGSG